MKVRLTLLATLALLLLGLGQVQAAPYPLITVDELGHGTLVPAMLRLQLSGFFFFSVTTMPCAAIKA